MAISSATATDAGGAVSDLLGGIGAYEGDQMKAEGLQVEGENYTLAANLATQNEEFSKESTAVQEFQAHRNLEVSEGNTQAQIGAAGMQSGGSGEDILRESAGQGAMQNQILVRQGLITQAGYQEQAESVVVRRLR